MSRPRLIALLLAFATLVVFLPAARFGFVAYDDNDYVTQNDFVKNGLTWTDLQWSFTAFHAGNWHPLTWISHMTDCELFGLNAGAHHFVNILFHAVNVALLFALLWRLTKKIWPAAFIAALFAWHPLHVESVAWIAERKDVLSTCFALLALLSYTRHVQTVTSDGWRVTGDKPNLSRITHHASLYFWLALLFFALGLLAKPMLVTLPCVMLLLDFWPLQRFQVSGFRFQVFLEKIPFFALTVVSCLVTFLAQRQGEAVSSLAGVSLHYRLENAPVAVVHYLQNFFLPVNLCAIYPMPEKIPALQVALSVATLILISAIAWHWRTTKPYCLVGWLWFLGTLVPVIGLVQVGGAAMADRYTYIPSIGFFIALVFLADDFFARLPTPKIITAAAAVIIAVACILATEKQLQFWRDSETLFRRAIAVTQHNDVALVNLGVALDAQGRFEEALVAYHQAEKIAPGRFQLHNNLGNILGLLGRHGESLAEYREAVRLRPDIAFLHNAAGGQLAALGQFADALKEFSEAGRLNPKDAEPHLETAGVLFQLGRDAEAVEELRAAYRLEPENFQILAGIAHFLAANENAAARDGKFALLLAIKANELAGRSQPMVFDVLGMACAESGDFTNAQLCAQNALDLAAAAQLKNTEQISQRLELYKNNRPWRESFRATNAPGKP